MFVTLEGSSRNGLIQGGVAVFSVRKAVHVQMPKIHIGPKLLVLGLNAAELFNPRLDKRRALVLYNQWRKVRALSKTLAHVLADSRDATSWPGDRLPVSLEFSEQIEHLTRRLQLETQAYGRMLALSPS